MSFLDVHDLKGLTDLIFGMNWRQLLQCIPTWHITVALYAGAENNDSTRGYLLDELNAIARPGHWPGRESPCPKYPYMELVDDFRLAPTLNGESFIAGWQRNPLKTGLDLMAYHLLRLK